MGGVPVECVGRRVKVLWEAENQVFYGMVVAADEERVRVKYDDGDDEWERRSEVEFCDASDKGAEPPAKEKAGENKPIVTTGRIEEHLRNYVVGGNQASLIAPLGGSYGSLFHPGAGSVSLAGLHQQLALLQGQLIPSLATLGQPLHGQLSYVQTAQAMAMAQALQQQQKPQPQQGPGMGSFAAINLLAAAGLFPSISQAQAALSQTAALQVAHHPTLESKGLGERANSKGSMHTDGGEEDSDDDGDPGGKGAQVGPLGLKKRRKPRSSYCVWTAAELEALQGAVKVYGRDWVSVAREVGTKSRKQCLQKVVKEVSKGRLEEPVNKHDKVPWTAEELGMLHQAVAKHGRDWELVSAFMGTRTNQQCQHKVDKEVKAGRMAEPEGKRDKITWSAEELNLLRVGVARHGHDWMVVSQVVGSRSNRQCKHKYAAEVKAGRLQDLKDAVLRRSAQATLMNTSPTVDAVLLEATEKFIK